MCGSICRVAFRTWVDPWCTKVLRADMTLPRFDSLKRDEGISTRWDIVAWISDYNICSLRIAYRHVNIQSPHAPVVARPKGSNVYTGITLLGPACRRISSGKLFLDQKQGLQGSCAQMSKKQAEGPVSCILENRNPDLLVLSRLKEDLKGFHFPTGRPTSRDIALSAGGTLGSTS